MAKTFKSLREAAEAGFHGKSVNIEGKGLQKVAFADKAYDKRMSELADKKSSTAAPKPRPSNLKAPRADRDQTGSAAGKPSGSVTKPRRPDQQRAEEGKTGTPTGKTRGTVKRQATADTTAKAQTPFQRMVNFSGKVRKAGGLSNYLKNKDK